MNLDDENDYSHCGDNYTNNFADESKLRYALRWCVKIEILDIFSELCTIDDVSVL